MAESEAGKAVCLIKRGQQTGKSGCEKLDLIEVNKTRKNLV
jgi:hypothetical protein